MTIQRYNIEIKHDGKWKRTMLSYTSEVVAVLVSAFLGEKEVRIIDREDDNK